MANTRWMVRHVVNGARVRTYFPTKKAADDFRKRWGIDAKARRADW